MNGTVNTSYFNRIDNSFVNKEKKIKTRPTLAIFLHNYVDKSWIWCSTNKDPSAVCGGWKWINRHLKTFRKMRHGGVTSSHIYLSSSPLLWEKLLISIKKPVYTLCVSIQMTCSTHRLETIPVCFRRDVAPVNPHATHSVHNSYLVYQKPLWENHGIVSWWPLKHK